MDEGLAVPTDPSAKPSSVTWVWSLGLPVPSFPQWSLHGAQLPRAFPPWGWICLHGPLPLFSTISLIVPNQRQMLSFSVTPVHLSSGREEEWKFWLLPASLIYTTVLIYTIHSTWKVPHWAGASFGDTSPTYLVESGIRSFFSLPDKTLQGLSSGTTTLQGS